MNFNKNFYSQKAVKSAIEAYQNLVDFKLKSNKKYIQVSLENIDKEVIPVIKDEFTNYVLFLSITKTS